MNDLFSDLLTGRLQPVSTAGTVNGAMNFDVPDEKEDELSDSSTESDGEQREYVEKEMKSYFYEEQDMDGLTDIDDGRDESVFGTDCMDLLGVPRVFEMYKFDTYYKKELPIDSFKNQILDLINTNSVVIIHGPTGCGKTTQVPQYIIDQAKAAKAPCNVVVTQPRRIAAINISQRVCEERGWALGTVCGYQVGLDKNVSDDVILTYMTTEVLLQKFISQKNLNRYTHIIIDEVHERNKSLDFLLLVVRKYLFTNSPAVKIVLMSATMEEKDFAYYFRSISRNNPNQYLLAPVLQVDKASEYETSIYYNEQFAKSDMVYNIDEPCATSEQYEMCMKLVGIFDGIEKEEANESGELNVGSVLVFLPGFHEIEEMNKLLMEKKTSELAYEIIPLHSSLSSDQMAKAFQKPKPDCRKIILSTNIAESSVTVPDVKYVIDFCLTKIMVTNESTKFSSLTLQWASRNNCTQRAGRVGRVSSGRVYRLVPYEFYLTQMQENTMPELQRAPLENVILYMKLLDLNDTPKNVLSLAISPPNLKDVETCIWHLKEVGALLPTCRGHVTSADGDLTFMGRIMGSLPIDIRLAKLIILGHMFCCLDDMVIIAAGCMTKNIFIQNFANRFQCYGKKLSWSDGSCCDFLTYLNLHKVWLNQKLQHAFRSVRDEYAWCKQNFVNLKGLREWDILIREIHNRLQRFHIATTRDTPKLSDVQKPTVLKVVICGAFYPNYFVRSSDYGQIDSKEAVKILNGRDPYSTVYFSNMKVNQPGHIYVRQIKEMLEIKDIQNVQIGFDVQSSKVFVEFKDFRNPEPVKVDGKEYVAVVGGKISARVYEAVRKRQLNVPFRLRILPDQKAWAFAEKIEEKQRKGRSEKEEEFNCYTQIEYSPLPSLDMEYITISVTHIVDAGFFYSQNWNDETRRLLDSIFAALNRPGMFLEPVGEKIEINGKLYAAKFHEDNKYYRCKVIKIEPGKPPFAHVRFVDYGNTQKLPVTYLCELPQDCLECKVEPIAMCCCLSEVQPHLVSSPNGLWPEKVNDIFRRKTEQVLLNAKVYSVVSGIVHLELFAQNTGRNSLSFNKWLIEQGYAQKCEESQTSKMDHELRQKVLSSEDPNNASHLYREATVVKNYTDYEAPERSEATEIIQLKGPFSPLETRVCGVMQASLGATVRIADDSVNAVMLDCNPDDPHAILLVAANVLQSSTAKSIKLSQTSIMPGIPGFPMVMTLLFCPQMEPKLTPDGTRVASVLCGLGYKEYSEKANYKMHDISLVLDTELQTVLVEQINQVRNDMNNAMKMMSDIYDETFRPEEFPSVQMPLISNLFKLILIRHNSVDRVRVPYADVWNKNLCEEVVILRSNHIDRPEDIWRMLWFVELRNDKGRRMSINQNLDEMNQIARRLVPEKEIVCQLCDNGVLKTIDDVRIHLFKEVHKKNLERYKESDNK